VSIRVLVRRLLPLLSACAILCVGRACAALPEYLDGVKAVHPLKPGGVIDSKGCDLCHAGATNRNSLNPYGKDFQAAINASADKKATAALVQSVDAKDSDGDGWPNSAEFSADTLPGDSASKPPGAPPSAARSNAAAGSEFNPFAFKEIFFPTSAQHPVVVHFPIALFVFSLFLDLLGIRMGDRAMNSAGYYNLIASALTGIASVISGLLAWKFAFELQPLAGLHANTYLLYHLILGVVTTVLLCVLWAMRARLPDADKQAPGRAYLAVAAITLCVVAVTGHLGGIVSGIIHP